MVSKHLDATNTNLIPALSGYLSTVFGLPGSGEGLVNIFDIVDQPEFLGLAAWNELDESQPRAYLNHLFFDDNFNFDPDGFGFAQLSESARISATNSTHEQLNLEFVAKRSGFLYVYLSNENDQNVTVYFDDFQVSHVYSDLVYAADYYPYGLVMSGREVDKSPYRYGYQGEFSEKEKALGLNSFYLRDYDARIGRWMSMDPMDQYWSPYMGMGNNPILLIDPLGGQTDCPECPPDALILDEVVIEGQRIYSGGYEIEFGITAPTGILGGNFDVEIPQIPVLGPIESKGFESLDMGAAMFEPPTIQPLPQETVNEEAATPASGVSEGSWVRYVPLIGSGIDAYDAFSKGNYLAGIFHTALAVSDVFLVKAAVTAVAKAGVKLMAKAAARRAARGSSNLWKVGSYNKLAGLESGLNAHHVGQKALMKRFVPNYNWRNAPSILVPESGHLTRSSLGIVSRSTKGLSNARQVLARDIFELRRVYGGQGIPNSSLQQLIQLNKQMYPRAFIK